MYIALKGKIIVSVLIEIIIMTSINIQVINKSKKKVEINYNTKIL